MSSHLRNPPLALYVHLPWCVRKCPYCDFNSHEAAGELPEQAYVQALLEDLEHDMQLLDADRPRTLHSVFIGGGTPSLFSARAIGTLLEGIDRRLSLRGSEITLEANPGSVETGRFREFRTAGINRLSVGVQSFHDHHLRRLGRIHDGRAARQAAEAAARAGFDSFNLDLMFGLPGQTMEEAAADARLATQLAGGHLSHYQLTIEPNTVFYRRRPALPPEDDIALMQDACAEVFAQAGYQRYEISAWSRPGAECRHNTNYWQFGDYLGIGAGAHGKITQARHGRILRRRRHRVPNRYLSLAPADRIVETTAISDINLPLEFAMNALRLTDGASLTTYEERTGLSPDTLLAPLRECMDMGLTSLEHGQLRATAAGLDRLNDLLLPLLPDSAAHA